LQTSYESKGSPSALPQGRATQGIGDVLQFKSPSLVHSSPQEYPCSPLPQSHPSHTSRPACHIEATTETVIYMTASEPWKSYFSSQCVLYVYSIDRYWFGGGAVVWEPEHQNFQVEWPEAGDR